MSQPSERIVSHTPGPWRISSRPAQLVSADGQGIALVIGYDSENLVENGRLIAAAPDLLNKSKALLDALDYQPLRELALQCGIPLYERAADLLDVIARIEGLP